MQAAVGGTALDLMQERGLGPVAEERGRLVLMLSVLVILLTAPIGALGIGVFGPMWLTQDGAKEGGEEKADGEAAGASGEADAPAALDWTVDAVEVEVSPAEGGEREAANGAGSRSSELPTKYL